MKKKQLKKLEISEMDNFQIIDSVEQVMLKGGYTVAEMEEMIDNGTWEGGQVDGMGYVGPVVNIYNDVNHCQVCGAKLDSTFNPGGAWEAWATAAGIYLSHICFCPNADWRIYSY